MKRLNAALPLILPLVAAAFIVSGCGGKAQARDAAGDGGGGAASVIEHGAGGDAAEPNAAAPSVVRIADGPGGAEDSNATAECIQGFQGFTAKLGNQTVDFKAFVFEPGDYMGDPGKILYLDVTQSGGAHYQAAAGTGASTGSISLHVEAVEPRFVGQLEAVLTNQDDAMAPELRLSLAFDIAVRAGCQ